MGSVEYVMRGNSGKAERRTFMFNSVDELAGQLNLVLNDLLTVDEMIDTIIDDMAIADQIMMSAMTFKELIEIHRNIGGELRNSFGLWVENNPNIASHPDDTSMEVLTGVWKRLTTSPAVTSQVMDFR